MPHIGRNWELAFRRDYGLNQFTENGPALHYRFSIGEFESPEWNGDRTFFFRGTNNVRGAGEGRIWDFEPLAMGGDSWAGTFTITNDQTLGRQLALVEIFSAFGGLQFSGNYKNRVDPDFTWAGAAYTLQSVNFVGPLLTPSRFITQCILDPWFWADGPF